MSIQERLANVKKQEFKHGAQGMHGDKHKGKHSEDIEPDVQHMSSLFTTFTSSLYVLAIKLKGFHWNIVGDQFFPIHVLLDQQVTELLAYADSSAELVRQINKAPAPISMKAMIDSSFIKEVNMNKLVTVEQILPVIITDYSSIIKFCEKVVKCGDKNGRQDLSDFAIGVRQFLDKYKWQFDSANK